MMVYFSELATAFMTALVLENLLFTRAIDIPSLYSWRPIFSSAALLRRCLPAPGTRCRFTASTASPWAR